MPASLANLSAMPGSSLSARQAFFGKTIPFSALPRFRGEQTAPPEPPAVPDALRALVGKDSLTTHDVTDETIAVFSILSGDRNRMHTDADFARRVGQLMGVPIEGTIAHGKIASSFVSTALAELFGHGTLYLGENAAFTAPVTEKDTLTVTLTPRAVFPAAIRKKGEVTGYRPGVFQFDNDFAVTAKARGDADAPERLVMKGTNSIWVHEEVFSEQKSRLNLFA